MIFQISSRNEPGLVVPSDAFLDAFASLGIEPWAGIEMDVAWGQTTLRFGLHRQSVTGPIFVYRVCTALRQDRPTRMQVLSHADLSPDQLLGVIAGQHPFFVAAAILLFNSSFYTASYGLSTRLPLPLLCS